MIHAGETAIRATVASGFRSTFFYCAHPRVAATWKPEFSMETEIFPQWVMAKFAQLVSRHELGPNGRIRLGFAIDGAYLPSPVLRTILSEVRAKGARLITSHVTHLGNRKARFTASFRVKHTNSCFL